IFALSARQKRILRQAAKMVRPGGTLVYSTCSVEPEENEEVAASFLDENGAFSPLPVNILPALQNADGTVRTWPHKQGADGFFMARFERRG
ncbi:MAG TPA: hypothetical protein VEV81_07715, partial [Pyrinomonadaceae bacterium]|nr:hypothetical protein [Pyrinomonadaceae bacterium]